MADDPSKLIAVLPFPLGLNTNILTPQVPQSPNATDSHEKFIRWMSARLNGPLDFAKDVS